MKVVRINGADVVGNVKYGTARRQRLDRWKLLGLRLLMATCAIIGMVALVLVFGAGCVSPQAASDWAPKTASTECEVYVGVFGAAGKWKDYKDRKGKLDIVYDPETKRWEFHADLTSSASTATQAQEGLMREWTVQQQQQIDGLKWVVEQIKAHGENIDRIMAHLESMLSSLTNVLNVSANKDGIQAGNQLARDNTVAQQQQVAQMQAAYDKLAAFTKEQQASYEKMIGDYKALLERRLDKLEQEQQSDGAATPPASAP